MRDLDVTLSRNRARPIAIAVALLTALGASASDKVPVQRPSDGGQIGAAAEQLKELKADAAARELAPRSSTAAISVPQISVPSANPPSALPAPSSEAVQKSAQNWLVDGVLKSKPRTAAEARSPDKTSATLRTRPDAATAADDDDDGLAVAESSGEKESADRRSTEEDRSERSRTTFDPMARYMADWLTPSDYALLRPAVSGSASTSTSSPGEVMPVGPDLTAALDSLAAPGASGGANDKTSLPIAKPADNPFLQFLAPPESETNVPVAPASPFNPSPAPPPIAAPAPPAEDRRPVSNLPDFVRPTSDDKYFKPLKKF